MKNLILIISLLSISLGSFSSDQKKDSQEKAKIQMTQLKEGVMLVRLSDKAPVIKALEAKGMEQRAKAIKAKQEATNKEIIAAFDGFDFCKVYFFYSNDSENLEVGNYNKVKLFESYDMLAKGIKLDSNFFVADFGMLKSEPESTTTSEKRKQSGISKQKKYKGSNVSTATRCMYLRDHNFSQLESPFPFYVRFHPSPIKTRTYKEVVEKMNEQLVKYN